MSLNYLRRLQAIHLLLLHASCTTSTCSNGMGFITDSNPYASGSDWGGVISAIAIGAQTSISAN
ncbi:MAG: hypothetical protein EKK54_04050 [Neisseriaceae bacterium]|nr:MAG: hypothetical protein EKK54_04050 [Neisseriaceae bacterium]